MIHVALLRGINVGGAHTLPMADLRRLCAQLGWADPVTYINSGNVVFAADAGDHAAMARDLQGAVVAEFGFRPRVLVTAGERIAAVAAAIPEGWTNDAQHKTDVVYLLDDVDPLQASAGLAPRDGIDHLVHAPGAIIWMVRRSDAARSGLRGIVGTPLYQQATIRNVNTARRLAALVLDRSSGPGRAELGP